MNKVAVCWLSILALGAVAAMPAHTAEDPTPAAQSEKETEAGIPVTNQLVIEKCGACHAPDDKGNMSRISWVRTTPEGWAEAIRRMGRLNGLELKPEEARSIIKYLSTWHGLAPEESKPVMYVPEKRIIDEDVPEDLVREACTRCHEYGKPMSWRRSKADWKLLENLHVALYVQAEVGFRGQNAPRGEGDSDTAAPRKRPGEAALEFLAKNAPLHTPEWAAWRSRIRAPRIAGKWLVSAAMPGHGRYAGEMVIEQGAAEDEFKTTVTLKSLTNGSVLKRTGTGLVYAGHSWRGRSKGAGSPGRPDDMQSEAREAVWFAPDQASGEGRWFWGEYNEFGFDVKLTRAGAAPSVVSVAPFAVKAGAKNAQLKIYGDGFPDAVAPTDFDLGAGVTVNKVVSRSKTEIVVDVDVAADAVSGRRDVDLNRSILEKGFTVYHKIDYVTVTPEKSLARLGGAEHPKGYQQFEAIGFENGADGKPYTPDDISLGVIDVTWSVEEFLAVYGDDDKDFVGSLSSTGFFTPAADGPNPKRKFGRNNYGDVWIVAIAKNEKDKDGRALSGRSRLIVTVPTYLRWDQPEVSR